MAELEQIGRDIDALFQKFLFSILFQIARRQELEVAAFEHGHQGVVVDIGDDLAVLGLVACELGLDLLEEDRAVDETAVQGISRMKGDDRDPFLLGQAYGLLVQLGMVGEPSGILIASVHVGGVGQVDLFYGEIAVLQDGRSRSDMVVVVVGDIDGKLLDPHGLELLDHVGAALGHAGI